MTYKNKLSTVLFMLAIACSNLAFSADGKFVVYGLGLTSCGKYSSLPKGGPDIEMANQWVFGFITAKNESLYFEGKAAGNSYLDGLDYHSVTKYVAKYCDENPIDSVYSAANKLIYDLSLRK